MKRTYTLKVEIEATFGRKIQSSSYKARLLRAIVKVLPDPWELNEASISVRTFSEAKVPEKKPTERALKLELRLEEAREIAEKMRKILRTVKRPKVHLYPNRWCDSGNFWSAHVHNSKPYRYASTFRKAEYGLICLKQSWLLMVSRERLERSLAHEICHLRMPATNHRRLSFKEGVDLLLSLYYDERPPEESSKGEDESSLGSSGRSPNKGG